MYKNFNRDDRIRTCGPFVPNEVRYQAKEGQIVDGTLIPVPKQHNTKEEKQKLALEEIPESWQQKYQRLS